MSLLPRLRSGYSFMAKRLYAFSPALGYAAAFMALNTFCFCMRHGFTSLKIKTGQGFEIDRAVV